MGASFSKIPLFKSFFSIKIEIADFFETSGKKTFKLICHTNVYEAIKDIIEKTDDDDNA